MHANNPYTHHLNNNDLDIKLKPHYLDINLDSIVVHKSQPTTSNFEFLQLGPTCSYSA